MAFSQRVRLPFYLTRPVFPATNSVFRLANGSLKVQATQVRKVFDGETDYMPSWMHEGLRIALLHDNVSIEGQKLVGKVAMEGDAYEIDWQRFLDYPTAKAEFKVQVDNYDFSNSNCISCEEASQLELVDDNLGVFDEGDSGSGNVFTNDNIFCAPVTASITTYSTVYLSAPPTISDSGAVNFTLNTPLPDVTAAKIFSYRVTCPGGGYDEADVFIDVNGSLAGCSAPDNLRDLVDPTDTTAEVTWDENGSPADGYYFELYRLDNLGSVVVSSTSPLGYPRAPMTGLTPCTDYKILVRAVCETGVSESSFSELTFSTDCPPVGCGMYNVLWYNGTPEPDSGGSITYLNCSNSYKTDYLNNMDTIVICARETSPGNPVDTSGNFTSIEYVGPC